MKTYTLNLVNTFLLLFSITVFAQAPQKMSYQATLRDANGSLFINVTVGIRISVLSGSASGTPVYVETHNTSTNQNGLVSIQIGGGNPTTGTFAGITWGTNSYFVKTETDPTGGTNYTITGTTQMMSVPYALYAENSKNLGKTSIYLTGDITDAQAALKIANESGPNTENIVVQNTTALTTLNFSNITTLIGLYVTNNAVLNSVALPNLSVTYNDVLISSNLALTSLNLPLLSNVNGRFQITGNNLTVLSFPSLTKSQTSTQGIRISEANVTNISFPILVQAEYLVISGQNLTTFSAPLLIKSSNFGISNSNITNLTFPSFTGDGNSNIGFVGNSLLTSVNLPVLNVLNQITIQGNVSLTTVNIPLLNRCTYIDFRQNKFPSSEINFWLNRLLTITPSTGKTIYLKTQNPLAPPTGQGITDKATLISGGNTVLTD